MSTSDFIDSLSAEQRQAALTTDTPVLIVAGAGSGKTRTLVGRFIHLVLPESRGGLGADASSIMMMTFTNKAAREMRERILPVLEDLRRMRPDQHVGEPWIGTFHSLSLRILRAEAARAGLSRNFSIYDEADARSLADDVAERLGRDRFDIDVFFRDLEFAKSRLLTPEILVRKAMQLEMKQDLGEPLTKSEETWSRVLGHFQTDGFLDIYVAYQRELKEQNAVDFSDLLNTVTTIFREDAAIRNSWRSQFRHFMVDEVQDANLSQIAWLQAFTDGGRPAGQDVIDLAETHENQLSSHQVNGYRLKRFPRASIAFVGDDDQSIYAFRGSDVALMRSLPDRYPGLRTLFLRESYRCQPAILSAANRLVAGNPKRFDKAMVAARRDRQASRIRIESFRSSSLELDRLVHEAGSYMRAGRDPGEYAVLLRTRELARGVAKAFRAAGLPVSEGKASDIRKSAEVRDVMAYAGFLVNPEAENFLRRIMNRPARGLGPTSIARVSRNARLKEISFLEEFRSILSGRIDLPDGAEAYGKAFIADARNFGSLLDRMRGSLSSGADAGAALLGIMEMSGYLPDLKRAALRSSGIRETADIMALGPRDFLTRLLVLRESDRLPEAGKGARDPEASLDDFRDRLDASSIDDVAEMGAGLSETARRIGNLGILLDQARHVPSLADFIQESSLEMGQGEAQAGFRIMTIHAAKGLEFDCVRLPFWVSGVIPHALSETGDLDGVAEECRLAYVAVTRARDDLAISHFHHNDLPFLRMRRASESVFLREMRKAGPHLFLRREIASNRDRLLSEEQAFRPPVPAGHPVTREAGQGNPRPAAGCGARTAGATPGAARGERALALKFMASEEGRRSPESTDLPGLR